jgi:hypothetical protein
MKRNILAVLQKNTSPVSREEFDRGFAPRNEKPNENATADATVLDKVGQKVFIPSATPKAAYAKTPSSDVKKGPSNPSGTLRIARTGARRKNKAVIVGVTKKKIVEKS